MSTVIDNPIAAGGLTGSRLQEGIWPKIRPWSAADSERAEREFRESHRAHALRAVDRLPLSFHKHVADAWDQRYGVKVDNTNGSPVAVANAFVRQAVQEFGDARAGSAYDEEKIRAYADNYAALCARMGSLAQRAHFARSFHIECPKGFRITREGACARFDDPMWWRRQLRKVWTRACESSMRRAGVIRKGKSPYASDEAVRHSQARNARMREWMESRVMVNGDGEQLELSELHDHSLANPALRRGEFMCRMRGFEEIATKLGDVALFFTLTTPSAFHCQLAKGGLNPKFQGFAPRDGQAWLRKMWARARSKLARLAIPFYGFRVAEPHHDATPHWHMVLFVRPEHGPALQRVLESVWLSEYGDEVGASERRTECKRIDPDEGSAVGYVAKYVSKNIDGAGSIGPAISDETGAPVIDNIAAIAAWAQKHGIRQFQQVGGPPVGLWRECRRARAPVESQTLESVRKTVSDDKSWSGMIEKLGGVERARRRVRSVRPSKYRREVTPPMIRIYRLAKVQWKGKCGPRVAWDRKIASQDEMPAAWIDKAAPLTTDAAGREILKVNRYGELPADRAAGVVAYGMLGRWACIDTRASRWKLQKRVCATNRSGVVNPPRSAARGREAGNPIAMQRAIHGRGDRPAGTYPGEGSWGIGPMSRFSFSKSGSDSSSGLGPVAITVRQCRCAQCESGDYSSSPFRPRAGPS